MLLILTTRFLASSLLMCRYLRRGVNEKGRVANDVETEQIVSKEVPEGQKIPITSVVQIRGSIPLFWSQETSLFNPQPEIICKHNIHWQNGSLVFPYLNYLFSVTVNKKDETYVATKNHFDNLRQRYGKRIIILNLLKVGFFPFYRTTQI